MRPSKKTERTRLTTYVESDLARWVTKKAEEQRLDVSVFIRLVLSSAMQAE